MSRISSRFIIAFSLVVILSTLVAACGAGPAAGGTQPVTVQVTLTDFKVDSSLTTFSVGVPYHFVVTNKGTQAHEFYIMAPTSTSTSSALAGISGQDLQAGASKTLDYTFTKAAPAGTLEFACHLPGHYDAGMHLPIVVQ